MSRFGIIDDRDGDEILRLRLREAEGLLGRWMFWASGVAFKSTDGECVEHDTDAFLAGTTQGTLVDSNGGGR